MGSAVEALYAGHCTRAVRLAYLLTRGAAAAEELARRGVHPSLRATHIVVTSRVACCTAPTRPTRLWPGVDGETHDNRGPPREG
jgi:hypothetical protein